MAGLLDDFSEFIKTPGGQGLLSAAFGGLAGAQKGAPLNSLGRAGLAGLSGYGGALDREKQAAEAAQMGKYRDMQAQTMQMQLEAAKRKTEQDARISAGMGQFFKPAQPALPPLMGDSSTGILPSAGRASVAPSFDATGAAVFLAQNGDYETALKYMPKPKEAPINKLDVKDFTPGSVAKFSQSGNYADLVRMDKAHFANTGGETVAVDPFTGQKLSALPNTQSPDGKASNAVAWANYGLSKDRLNFDKSGGNDTKPKLVGDQWVTAPANMGPGQVVSAFPSVAKKDAQEALQLIQTAKEIIPKSTGSYLGVGVDQAARVFGASTGGDTAAAQLKALEGALVAKMPKMSGPQSDKDVLLYKQMAGEIGNPTIPQSRKLAALQVIEEIQNRHAGNPSSGVSGGWSIEKVR